MIPHAPRWSPANSSPGAPPSSRRCTLIEEGGATPEDLSEIRETVFQVRHALAGKESFMKKIRSALVAISTLALVVLSSGIAEALPRLKPNW